MAWVDILTKETNDKDFAEANGYTYVPPPSGPITPLAKAIIDMIRHLPPVEPVVPK